MEDAHRYCEAHGGFHASVESGRVEGNVADRVLRARMQLRQAPGPTATGAAAEGGGGGLSEAGAAPPPPTEAMGHRLGRADPLVWAPMSNVAVRPRRVDWVVLGRAAR